MLLAKTFANYFELKGPKSTISYGIDLAGNPQIVFNNKAYFGVQEQRTAAGPMASVLIESVADDHATYLSLLIPPVQLPEGAARQSVETFAIFSTHKTSFAGPTLVNGQTIDYKVEALKGTATYVLT